MPSLWYFGIYKVTGARKPPPAFMGGRAGKRASFTILNSNPYFKYVEGIRAGNLQYRGNNIYGIPYLRLIRHEVEVLINEKYGHDYQMKKELPED